MNFPHHGFSKNQILQTPLSCSTDVPNRNQVTTSSPKELPVKSGTKGEKT